MRKVLSIMATALYVAMGLILGLVAYGWLTMPTLDLTPPAQSSPTVVTVEDAERMVSERVESLTDESCTAEPTGIPASAIVKRDGTVADVSRIPFDDALALSQSGEVWVLQWCSTD